MTKLNIPYNRKKPGNAKFFGLTHSGFVSLIVDPDENMNSNEFWKITILCFDTTYKDSENLQIFLSAELDQILKLFLKICLKIDLECSPILFEILFRKNLFSVKENLEKLDDRLLLLDIIGTTKKCTVSKILKKKPVILKNKQICNVMSLYYFLDDLVGYGLLVKKLVKKNIGVIINSETDIEYSLSHSGLILLIENILNNTKRTRNELIHDAQGILNDFFILKIQKIMDINDALLPMIFKNNRLEKIRKTCFISYYVLLEWWIQFYFKNYENQTFSAHILGVWTSLNLFKLMQPIYHHRVQTMMNSGNKILEEWLHQKKRLFYFDGQLPKDYLSQVELKFFKDAKSIIPFYPSASTALFIADDIVLSDQKYLHTHFKKSLKEKISANPATKILYPIRKPLEVLLWLNDISNYNEYNAKFDFTIIKRHHSLDYDTIGSIISFHFYTLLNFLCKKEQWNSIFENDDELKKWYTKWNHALTDFSQEHGVGLKSLEIK